MSMISMEDAYDAKGWGYDEPRKKTINEKKKEVKKILENDIELLNEIVVDIRKDKIDKIKNK